MSASRTDLPTTMADGRYEIVSFLGQGGRKRVYLAKDRRLKRQVAVSVVRTDGVDDTSLERARREAEAMAALGDHPNIVNIYDIGEEDGQLFLVSQYMAGGALSDLAAEAEAHRLPIDEVIRIGIDVARGLEHAHAKGVIHRDIKPQNVWLSPSGAARLGDFGLAVESGRSRLTTDGSMVGTVAYMSPEQGLGRSVDARSDLYAFGAMLYELACGVPPFVADDAAALIAQHVSATPAGLTMHRPEIPAGLDQLVLTMLAKSADERPEDAPEVREALEALAGVVSGQQPITRADAALDRLALGTTVGRDSELEKLRTTLDESMSGRGRVVLIAGAGGLGKSQLAGDVATHASIRGALTLTGRCYDDEGAPPYWPWVQIIRSFVQDAEPDDLRTALGTGAADIARIVPAVRERLPDIPEPDALDADHARFRLFDSVATFLLNVARTTALSIAIGDLHLGDPPSLQLLDFLVPQIAGARMHLVCTYREDGPDPDGAKQRLVAKLDREAHVTRLRLLPLTETDVRGMIERILGQQLEEAAELNLARSVFEVSEGNPGFIEEIVRHLIETGALTQRDSRWVMTADSNHLDLPPGVREALTSRLSRLSADATEFLSTAAVLGRSFRLDAVERVTGGRSHAGTDGLQEALDADILEPLRNDPGTLVFTQSAAQDVLYERLDATRRAELHLAAGEAMEVLYEEHIESHLSELARHFTEAAVHGSVEIATKAAEYAWWAGERATSVHSYEEAARQYVRALELFARGSDEPVRRCELLLAVGDSHAKLGEVDEAKSTFRVAAALAQEHGLHEHHARAALGYGAGRGSSGFVLLHLADRELIDFLRTALASLPNRDSRLRVRLLARMALELYLEHDPGEARGMSQEAVEMADRIGDPRIRLQAIASHEWVMLGMRDPEELLASTTEMERLAELVGSSELAFQAHHLALVAHLELGDIAAAEHDIRRCGKLAKDLHQPVYDWQVTAFKAMRELTRGRFSAADSLATQAFSVGHDADSSGATAVLGTQVFLTRFGTGELEGLKDGSLNLASRFPLSAWPAVALWLFAELDEQREAREMLATIVQRGIRQIRRDAHWVTSMAALAISLSQVRDRAAAEEVYELLEPLADRFIPVLVGSAFAGSVQFFLGMMAEVMGHVDRAVEHLEASLERNANVGFSVFEPRNCYWLAHTLLARDRPGDADRAATLIERGLEQARVQEMPSEVERLMGLRLGELGVQELDTQSSIAIVATAVEQTRPDLTPAAAPDGTVTIMFSDIEDSTILTEHLGDRRWMELLRHHNALIRRLVDEHDGFEVKAQGDGFMLAFASARNAIHCARSIQQELAAHRDAQPDAPVRVRIGLHTGEVLREEEDFFGRNVILAARIAGQADGGEILVSWLVRELVASSQEFEFGERRDLELKGMRGTHAVFEVPWA